MRAFIKRHKYLAAAAALILIAAAAAGIYMLNIHRIRTQGIDIKPAQDTALRDVRAYLQNDPQWANEPLGGSRYKMGGSGCLVSCVAMSLGEFGIDITPQQLNERLTAISGFENGELAWYKINELFPDIDYKYSRTFSSANIDSDLRNGLLPIVKVQYMGGGVQHWLLIVGAQKGEYMVLDPLHQSGEPIPLSTHGRVYAYRVLVRADGAATSSR